MDAFIKELAAQLGISEAEAQALWGQIQAGEGGDAVTDAARKAYRIALQNPDTVTVGEVRQLQRILGIAPLPRTLAEVAEVQRESLAGPSAGRAVSVGTALAAPPTGGTDSLAEYQRQTTPGIRGPEVPGRFQLPSAPDDLQLRLTEGRLRDRNVTPPAGRTQEGVALTLLTAPDAATALRTLTRMGMNPDMASRATESQFGPVEMFARGPAALPALGAGFLSAGTQRADLTATEQQAAGLAAAGGAPFYSRLTPEGEAYVGARLRQEAAYNPLFMPQAPKQALPFGLPAGAELPTPPVQRKKKPAELAAPKPTTSALGTTPGIFGSLGIK